ncbi:MAG: low specificity L-threonine aldolase [Spirochaetaceae bacterium]|nr:low specificity L-threonine aldolase [Spirochaetaceae bacterium]
MEQKLSFSSDYMEGAHPRIIERLSQTNFIRAVGYGLDEYCASAKHKICTACQSPNAQVEFLVGGTQTNATVIRAFLKNYQGVIASDTGHINTHEAGAIEATGHKVITLPQTLGKLVPAQVEQYLKTFYADANYEHSVQPGMVYISQPTEYGTLYSLDELTQLRTICLQYKLYLYVDGARLAYALASEKNTITLPHLAQLCDVFYIGGTKCGALFGEAVVIPQPNLIPHFFTTIKQQGALLAKGRLLGIQFDELFTNGLYFELGRHAIEMAHILRTGLAEKGAHFFFDTPTNQLFLIVENSKLPAIQKITDYGFWETYDESKTVIRFATSWATRDEDIKTLLKQITL